MTALAKKRIQKPHFATVIELPATAATYFQGGVVCWDTSTGLVAKAAASTTMLPIGTVEDGDVGSTIGQVTVASGGTINVKLFRELKALWMVNATSTDAVVAANLGGLAYLVDDQTVANNDATNTRSVAGRIWKLDTTTTPQRVLVEFRQSAGDARLTELDS